MLTSEEFGAASCHGGGETGSVPECFALQPYSPAQPSVSFQQSYCRDCGTVENWPPLQPRADGVIIDAVLRARPVCAPRAARPKDYSPTNMKMSSTGAAAAVCPIPQKVGRQKEWFQRVRRKTDIRTAICFIKIFVES